MGPRSRELLVAPHGRRPVERGVPVRHLARDLARLGAGARHPHHLRRRARLGALRPDGVRRRRLRRRRRGRRRPGPPPRRLPRDGLAADGEGVPLLGPRPRQRGHARWRPAWASRCASTSDAASSAATRSCAQREQAARPPPRRVHARRSGAAAASTTSRSGATARSSAGSPPARTATRSAARWAWATSRTPTASTRRFVRYRPLGAGDRDASAFPARAQLAPPYDPTSARVRE